MKLTLSSPLSYKPTESSFDDLSAKAADAAPGYDAAMLYEIKLDDILILKRIGGGERYGYTENEKEQIEKGMPPVPKEDETFIIPSGTYDFEQLPALFEEKDIARLILPYAAKNRFVYIRLFHENAFETVMQFFFPR